MKLVPTPEHRDLAAMLRRLFAEECPPSLVRRVKDGGAFPQLWKALAETGVLGLAIDERHGGAGAGLAELGVFFAEGGRALCPAIAYSTVVFGLALDRMGTAQQRDRYLPALAAGELTATVAAWNPSDAGDRRPVLAADRVDGGWAVSGTLPAMPHPDADIALVTARARTFAEPVRELGLLVEPGAAGRTVEPRRTMAGAIWGSVQFDEVFVPDEQVLGVEELPWVANAAVALQCREMAGGAAAVLERTVDHIGTRVQFGRPIGSFQAAQHLVADVHIAVAGARLAAEQAVFWVGRGERATRQVAIAKMQCSEAYKAATLTAHQLHGGYGYVRETDLHLWSERAKVAEVLGGTADVAAGWAQEELGLVP